MTDDVVALPPGECSGTSRRAVGRRLAFVHRRPAEGVLPVCLIDDDAMARSWFHLSLRASEFRVVAEARSAAEALAIVPRREPVVIVIDHRLPDATGTDLVGGLRARGVEGSIVLTSTTLQAGFNEAARRAGAQGTLLKTGSPSELIAVLRAVRAGAPGFDRRYARAFPAGLALSPRELDVLKLVAEGATNREIAALLGIGLETVKTLLRRAFAKLGVSRRVQAVGAAHELGLV